MYSERDIDIRGEIRAAELLLRYFVAWVKVIYRVARNFESFRGKRGWLRIVDSGELRCSQRLFAPKVSTVQKSLQTIESIVS